MRYAIGGLCRRPLVSHLQASVSHAKQFLYRCFYSEWVRHPKQLCQRTDSVSRSRGEDLAAALGELLRSSRCCRHGCPPPWAEDCGDRRSVLLAVVVAERPCCRCGLACAACFLVCQWEAIGLATGFMLGSDGAVIRRLGRLIRGLSHLDHHSGGVSRTPPLDCL